MIDIYLRFDTREQAIAVLEPLGMTYADEENNQHISPGSHSYALWEVDQISGISGYHINMRIIDLSFDTSMLEPYTIMPRNPICRWA